MTTQYNQSAPISDGVVAIRTDSAFALVEPPCEDTLRPLLSYEDVTFVASPNGRICHRRVSLRAYARQDQSLLIAAGCVPRVRDYLEQRGYDVVVEDLRGLDPAIHAIDEGYVPEVERAYPGLAAAVTAPVQGVLAVPRGRQRHKAIGHLCRLLPQARIFIAAARVATTQSMAADLAPYADGDVAAVRGGNWRSPCRVVCGTFTSSDRSEPQDWDVLIFEDANEATARMIPENRSRYRRHRIYAFTDPQRRASAKEELLHEILAGPLIYQIPSAATAPRLDVHVASYSAPSLRLPDDLRDRKQAFWAHQLRNQAIAEVAQAVADGDGHTRWHYGVFLDEADRGPTSGIAPGVAIVVESAEHGRHLARLLPDWPLLHALPGGTGPVLPSCMRWSLPPRSIVTAAFAARLKQIPVGTLVMAAGGARPQLPAALGRSTGRTLIIDLDDDFDVGLAAETQQRLHAYRSLGCTVYGAPRPAPAIDVEYQLIATVDPGHPSGNHTGNTSRRRRRRPR